MRRTPRTPPRRKPAANVQIAENGEAQPINPTEPVYSGRKPGRPSLLTPEVERMFINCLKAGSYRTVCARMCGLSAETVEKWILRGRGQLTDRPATEPFRRFVRLVEEAEATTEVIVVGNLVNLSKKDHNAALAWLRANPERRARWGVRTEDDDEPFGPPPQRQLPAGSPAAAALMPGNTTIDARQVNVVVLQPDQVPGVVHDLLEQQRAERSARLAEARHAPVVEIEDGGGRVRRLDALRVETDDTEPDDDD